MDMDKSHTRISLWVSLRYGDRATHLTDHKLSGLFKKCLLIAQDINDNLAELVACDQLGAISFRLLQFNDAIKYNEIVLSIAKQKEIKYNECIAYGNLGNCYSSLGDYNKAAHHNLLCLYIAKEIGDKEAETRAYCSLGNCYHSLGLYDEAIHNQVLSLNIAGENGYKASEGGAYSSLGNCYHSLGQYYKAIRHHEMGLRITKEVRDKLAEGRAYGHLGNCYRSLQQYDKAILHYTKFLEIARQNGDIAGEGSACGSLGSCYAAFRQYDEAISHHELQLEISKRIGDKEGESYSHGNMGICYRSLRQYEKAVYHVEIQLNIAKKIGRKVYVAAAHNNLSSCYFSSEQYQKAELKAEESLQCYEKLFESTPKEDQFKISIRDTFITTYRLLTEALLNQGNTKKALVVTENGRARALAGLMFNSFSSRCVEVAEPTKLELCEMTEVVKSLCSSVLYLSFGFYGICEWLVEPNGEIEFKKERKTHDASAVEQEIMSLISKAHKQDMVRCASNCEDRSLSFLYPEDETENDIENTDFSITPKVQDSLESLEITSHCSAAVVTVRGDAKDITTRSTHSLIPDERSISARESDRSPTNPLKMLYQLILAPVQKHVKGNQLVVVANGVLNLVPFSALMDEDGHYVAETLQVRLVPSLLTAKLILDRPQDSRSQVSTLIVGDPDVSVIFPKVDRLPCARKEAQMIGQLLGVHPFTGKTATKESFLQNVESANLIHVAAHGDMRRGEILFGLNTGISREKAKKKDYMLLMSDLEKKRLKAKLVVLSCCNNARGHVRADGVIGIARAFLGAGARSVLVALWKINDKATLLFMKTFYQHLSRGESASEALDQAMKGMRNSEEFSDPRYWAPFVLIGDNVSLF